jgi:hypothetical protein
MNVIIQNSTAAKGDEPLAGLFETGPDWTFATLDRCKEKQIFPNKLGFCEETGIMALIAKKSNKGADCALSRGGRDFLVDALANGARKDGKPVRGAYVVFAEADQYSTNALSLKLIRAYAVQEEVLRKIEPELGDLGWYWWVNPLTVMESLRVGGYVIDEGF